MVSHMSIVLILMTLENARHVIIANYNKTQIIYLIVSNFLLYFFVVSLCVTSNYSNIWIQFPFKLWLTLKLNKRLMLQPRGFF